MAISPKSEAYSRRACWQSYLQAAGGLFYFRNLEPGQREDLKEGLTPLLDALPICSEVSQREAKPLLPKIFPLSLEGEGD